MTAEEAVEAGPEALVVCEGGVRHSVEALSEAVCLLHVTTSSSPERKLAS